MLQALKLELTKWEITRGIDTASVATTMIHAALIYVHTSVVLRQLVARYAPALVPGNQVSAAAQLTITVVEQGRGTFVDF